MVASVAVLLEDLVEDAEFLYPYLRFKEEGFETLAVAPRRGVFKGKKGCPHRADASIEEVKGRLFDCLYVPGGYAPDRLRRYPEVLEMVRRHYEAGKIVAAVCHGPWVLISAKIVKGKRITGFFAIKDDIENAGAIYTGREVEEDGNIITATDPNAMVKQLPLIIKRLRG